MQLNDFTGGINNRQSKFLINKNNSIYSNNVDYSSSTLKPVKSYSLLDIKVDYPYIYKFNDIFISSKEYRSYVRHQDTIYWCDGINLPKKYKDKEYNLGIQPPTEKLDVKIWNTAGHQSGTYKYCYTYYNSKDGTESNISPWSDEITVSGSDIGADNIIPSTDPQVDTIRIYRLGGELSDIHFVTEIPNSQTWFYDKYSDSTISSELLPSYDRTPPKSSLKGLMYFSGFYVGFYDNYIEWSKAGNANYWDPFNYIEFEETITGIGYISEGLLVFLKNKTYIIQGTDPSVFVKYILSNSQGCIDYRTINYIKNNIIWISNDGLCSLNNLNVEILSEEFLITLNLENIVNSVVYNEVYYLLSDDKIYTFDFRYHSLRFYYLTFDINYLYYNSYEDILYCVNSELYIGKMFSGNNSTFSIQLPYFSDGSISMVKLYNQIYIAYKGNIHIKSYINENLVIDKELNSENFIQSEILPIQVKQRGNYITFDISGTGEVYEIEYKIQGRQNGR